MTNTDQGAGRDDRPASVTSDWTILWLDSAGRTIGRTWFITALPLAKNADEDDAKAGRGSIIEEAGDADDYTQEVLSVEEVEEDYGL